MTDLIGIVMDFTDTYPILPPFFIVYCSLCAIPVVILIKVTRRCALHKNCRFLLTLWALFLIGTLIDTTLLSLYTLTYEAGYLHRSLKSPFFRPYLLVFHSVFYCGGSGLEMFIALERILSCLWPSVYHSSGLNHGFLLMAFLVSLSAGFTAGYVLYIKSFLTAGIMIYNVIDIITLMVNACGIRFCKYRYRNLYGKGTLNARYQVNEAYVLARAMHPVYLGSFIIKIFAVCIAYTYVFLLNYFDGLVFALIETLYCMVHAFNCAFSSTFLMMKHKSLRRAVRKMLFKGNRIHRTQVSYVTYTKEESSVAHFNLLDLSWK